MPTAREHYDEFIALRDRINRDRGLSALDAAALLNTIAEECHEDVDAACSSSGLTLHDVRMRDVLE